MKKILLTTVLAFATSVSCAMDLLPLEEQNIAHKFHHVKEIKRSLDGKILEIKAVETEEIRDYRRKIKAEIRQKLQELYSKNFASSQSSAMLKCFDEKFDVDETLQGTYNVIAAYIRYMVEANLLHSYVAECIEIEMTELILAPLMEYASVVKLNLDLKPLPDRDNFIYAEIYTESCEKNWIEFSEQASPELFSNLPKDLFAGFSPENVRVITAHSILRNMEAKKMLSHNAVKFYRDLMPITPDNNNTLHNSWGNLLKNSDFTGRADFFWNNSPLFSFDAGIDKDRYIANLLKIIESCMCSKSMRESLIIFLAVNEYVETRIANHKLYFMSSDGVAAHTSYPDFYVQLDPLRQLEALTCFLEKGSAPSTLGLTTMTFGADCILSHELRHGFYEILGFNGEELTYVNDYTKNPFMKELLFSDFDKIHADIKQSIGASLNGATEAEARQFGEQVKNHFGLVFHPMGYGPSKFRAVTTDIGNRNDFSEDMALKLAWVAIDHIWNDPEEVYNIIGVQLYGKTLIINQMSDLDARLSTGKPVRWTHKGNREFNDKATQRIRTEERPPVTDLRAQKFVDEFYEKYELTTDPLCHPTPRALRALEILHGKI